MPPTLALFTGDPGGIGPELVAKVISAPESLPPAHVHLIASRANIEAAAHSAGIAINFHSIHSRARIPIEIIAWEGWENPPPTAKAARGEFVLAGLRFALHLAHEKRIDAVCFGPIERDVLRATGMVEQDDLSWVAQACGDSGPCHEIRVLDNLWLLTLGVGETGEMTPITASDVAGAVCVLDDALRRAGKCRRHIAVCAPQRHAEPSEDTNLRVAAIEHGVRLANVHGVINAEGPLPANLTLARARIGEFDGVVTTEPNHESAPAPMAPCDRAVTLLGGLHSAVTTTAHGIQGDIAGQGIANPWALRNAMALAVRIACA